MLTSSGYSSNDAFPIYLGGENPEVIEYKPDTNGTPPVSLPTDTAHDGGAKDLPDTGTLVNEPPKVEDNNIYYAKETNDEFLARIGNLEPNERVARIKEKAIEVAKESGWTKAPQRILNLNMGRTIYTDGEFYYSLDTLHGTFEKLTKKRKHLGEINMDKKEIVPPDGKTSDIILNGVNYDVYTPKTSNIDNIVGAVAKKNSQGKGVILDLSKTSVKIEELTNIQQRIEGSIKKGGGKVNIKEIIILPKE